MDVDLIRLDEIGVQRDARLRLARLRADAHSRDIVKGLDDALGPEQSQCELEVVARGPHHDAERASVKRELEWFLRGDLIAIVAPIARAPARDLDRRRLRARHVWMLGAR